MTGITFEKPDDFRFQFYLLIKAATDKIVAAGGIVLFLPVIFFYSIFILIFFRINPFFFQEREIGDNYRKVRILKLRTMKPGAKVYNVNEESLRKLTSIDAFLPLGRMFRRTGIDETPQLFNVLIGRMSIIGPRPLTSSDITLIMTRHPGLIEQRNRLKSKPGISGLWQINRGPELNFSELVRFDLEYERAKGFRTDIKIFIATLGKILSGGHIDSIK